MRKTQEYGYSELILPDYNGAFGDPPGGPDFKNLDK